MKCKHFEVYLALTYDKCMRICNQNPHQDTQHSSQHSKCLLTTFPESITPQRQSIFRYFPFLIGFTSFRIHTNSNLHYELSFKDYFQCIFFRFIHLIACISNSFLFITIEWIYSSVFDKHVICFQFLALINKVSFKIVIEVSLDIYAFISFGWSPRSGITCL